MRSFALLACLIFLLPFSTGCSRFSGEWVQDGTIDRDGTFTAIDTDNRLALKFTPPSTVRVGRYLAPAGVVDRQSTSTDTYFTMKHRTVAQFNGMSLRIDEGHLVGYVDGENKLRFTKMRGASIFPPAAILPSLAEKSKPPIATPSSAELMAAR